MQSRHCTKDLSPPADWSVNSTEPNERFPHNLHDWDRPPSRYPVVVGGLWCEDKRICHQPLDYFKDMPSAPIRLQTDGKTYSTDSSLVAIHVCLPFQKHHLVSLWRREARCHIIRYLDGAKAREPD